MCLELWRLIFQKKKKRGMSSDRLYISQRDSTKTCLFISSIAQWQILEYFPKVMVSGHQTHHCQVRPLVSHPLKSRGSIWSHCVEDASADCTFCSHCCLQASALPGAPLLPTKSDLIPKGGGRAPAHIPQSPLCWAFRARTTQPSSYSIEELV